jgi:hypothetical protein
MMDMSQPNNSILQNQLQTFYRSLLQGGGQKNQETMTGDTPLGGGQTPGQQQGQQGTQYSALGTAASMGAAGMKALAKSLGGQSSDQNMAGGPDEGTADSANVAGGPDITPADSGSMSSSFFSGLFGS